LNQQEKELVNACLRGSLSAQKTFYELFCGNMFAICLRYCSRREEAEDVLQEGFIKVFQNLERFRFEGSLEGWVKRIMVNTALGWLRARNVRFVEGGDIPVPEMKYSPGILEQMSSKEILVLIQQLPAGYRTVFNLHAIEGYSHAEIAGLLGIKEVTSRSQYLKARKVLQDAIRSKNSIRT
jgi:RNA polymerase sigma factor (sigma-70 family)